MGSKTWLCIFVSISRDTQVSGLNAVKPPTIVFILRKFSLDNTCSHSVLVETAVVYPDGNWLLHKTLFYVSLSRDILSGLKEFRRQVTAIWVIREWCGFTLRDNTCGHCVLVPTVVVYSDKVAFCTGLLWAKKRPLVRSTAMLCARFVPVWVFEKLTNHTCTAQVAFSCASPVHYKLSL